MEHGRRRWWPPGYPTCSEVRLLAETLTPKAGRKPVCYETGGLKRAMFGISGHRFLRFWFWYERMRWLGHQRCSQASTRHVQHTFQVVDHRRQAERVGWKLASSVGVLTTAF